MLYTVNLDSNNYILSIAHTDHDDTALDINYIDGEYINCYKLINGVVILDAEKKAEEIHKKEEEKKKPSELEALEAQCLYTALMTDTLLGGDELE